MVTRLLLGRALRRLHHLRDSDPVPGELRGWSYDYPPVKPRAYLGLGVSDVAYGAVCGWRSLWLRRRGVRLERTPAMEAGLMVHEAFHRASADLRRLLARGARPWEAVERLVSRARSRMPGNAPWWAVELYRMLVVIWAGEAAGASLYYGGEGLGWLPWLTEYRVDGSPLGLSRGLRVDALGEAGVVVEVKLGRPSWWHRLALAGYALALESYLEAPVDYGVVVGVQDLETGRPRLLVEPVYLSPDLREEFLRARDEAIEAVLSEVEPPETPCNGGGVS